MTDIDVIALATSNLTINLISELRKSGALSEQQVASIFDNTIRAHRSVTTVANDAAAAYLEDVRSSVERG